MTDDDDDRALARMARLFGPGFVKDAEAGFIKTIEFKRGRGFVPDDYRSFMGAQGNEKLEPLPNAVPVDPLYFLNTLASCGHGMTPLWGHALMRGRNQWTQFFLTSWMHNGLDGGGYAVTYDHPEPVVRQFWICKHEVEDHPGANHSRGWHPGHCKKCGFDLTYDSGD